MYTVQLEHLPKPHFAKDAYKVQHFKQYPPGTEYVYSNMTARGAHHFHWEGFNGKIVNIGARAFVQKYLKEYWDAFFFRMPLDVILKPYQAMINSALGKDSVTTDHIVALHNLGYLPLRVKALPEGTLVNLRVPLMTVINTLPEFYWLTNFIETIWSNECWKVPTAATVAYEYQRLFHKYAILTGSPVDFIPYQGHCFADRGMSGHEDAANTNVAHSLSFIGSDSLESGDHIEHCYGLTWENDVIMQAPPATEHAVMCANYAVYGELGTYIRLLTEVYPDGMCAIVSDTEDYWGVLTNVLPDPQVKDIIMNRPDGVTGPGKLVIRPDSGVPYDILCGANDWPIFAWTDPTDEVDATVKREYIHRGVFNHYHDVSADGKHNHRFFEDQTRNYILRHPNGEITYHQVTWAAGSYSDDMDYIDERARVGEEVRIPGSHGVASAFEPTPEEQGTFQWMWEVFGGTSNDMGFRFLDSHIGAIYGEAILLPAAEKILKRLMDMGFASANAVFGIGSFSYQYMTRDTFGIAVKATWCQVNSEGLDLQKKPKTDSGVKVSAKGLMRVEYEEGNYVVYEGQTWDQEDDGELEPIFVDGFLYNKANLGDMRELLHPTVNWPSKPAPEARQEAEDELPA
jgi:nicotinamide phosphoribosyltransferase